MTSQEFVVFLVTLGALNGVSAVAATKINSLFTIAKTLALAMIIIAGIVKMAQGNCDIILSQNE